MRFLLMLDSIVVYLGTALHAHKQMHGQTSCLHDAIMEAGAYVHLDSVVWELIAGHQHLSLFLFHSPLLVGICMRVQELGDSWMLGCNCFIQGRPSPEVPIKG